MFGEDRSMKMKVCSPFQTPPHQGQVRYVGARGFPEDGAVSDAGRVTRGADKSLVGQSCA